MLLDALLMTEETSLRLALLGTQNSPTKSKRALKSPANCKGALLKSPTKAKEPRIALLTAKEPC